MPAALLLFPFLSGCSWRPTYPKEKLAEAVREICRKEYDLEADAHLTGKTLYVACRLDGLVGRDLGLQRDTLDKLEGAMLSSTRAALSTDAEVDFLVVKARDLRLGSSITLIRHFPDIKGLIFYKVSRSDFDDRLILESDTIDGEGAPEDWHDMDMNEFMARLAASRLQRQFTSNPLISVFLQIHKVGGRFAAGVLELRADKYEAMPQPNAMAEEILRNAVVETVSDVLEKYNQSGAVTRVRVRDGAGRALMDLTVPELMDLKKNAKSASPA